MSTSALLQEAQCWNWPGTEASLFIYSFGGQRTMEERLVAIVETGCSMNKAKQDRYWNGLDEFSARLKAKEVKTVTQSGLKALLSELGLQPVSWSDWSKLLSRCRGLVAAQNRRAIDGRYYSQPASTPQELALLMCYGDCDAMTGQPLAILDRSLDAYAIPHPVQIVHSQLIHLVNSITLEGGHALGNVCAMSKWHNYFKGSFFPFYTREALRVWGVQEMASHVAELTPTRMAGKLCWDLMRSFIASVLSNEEYAGQVSAIALQPSLWLSLTAICFTFQIDLANLSPDIVMATMNQS